VGLGEQWLAEGILPYKEMAGREQGETLRTTRKIDKLGMNGNDGLEIH